MTRKWIEINGFSGGQYFVNKTIRFKTPKLILDLYDHIDEDIVVKKRISDTDTNNANRRNRRLQE